MIKLHKSKQSVPETEWNCEKCRDSGWLISPDGGAGAASRCKCQSPKHSDSALREALSRAGLERDELHSALNPWLEQIGGQPTQPAPKWAGHWLKWMLKGGPCPDDVREIFDGTPQAPTLTLLGSTGVGKTKIAAMLVRQYLQTGNRTYPMWVQVAEAIDRVQQERGANEGYSRTEERIKRAGLLVLDEFGLAHRRDSDGALGQTISAWLAYRHRRRSFSILTTNAESLSEIGDARLESRLAEGLYRCLEGPDVRDLKGLAA